MKYVSYSWLVIEKIATLLIAWLIFSKFDTSFETVIFSILLILYAHAVSASSGLAVIAMANRLGSTKQFLHLLTILKKFDPAYKEYERLREAITCEDEPDYLGDHLKALYYEDEDTKEELKKQENKLNELAKKTMISGMFISVLYLLAAWKIIASLM